MRLKILAAAVAFALASLATIAQQPATSPGDATVQPAPSAAELDKQYAQLQEQMKQMHDQMAKIAQTQDPEERQRLLQQHWASMQGAMGAMHSAWGGMMGGPMMGGHVMGGPMMGGHMMMWGDYRNLTPEQLRERQYMMDRWMPMQQMMMEQMMQHQHWMQTPPAPPPAKKK